LTRRIKVAEYQAASDILTGRPKYPHDPAVAGEVKERS
jgi:hypothetical protein